MRKVSTSLLRRLPQSVESARGKILDKSVPKSSVLRTGSMPITAEQEDWSLREIRLDNSRKRSNITTRDSNPQSAFPKQTK
jgi:hypothetical protein